MKVLIAILISIFISGCGNKVSLYRNSIVIPDARYLVAVFAGDGLSIEGNQDNCLTAAKLFMSQPAVETKFWCEG